MPVPIYFEKAEHKKKKNEEDKKEERKPINDTKPLWLKKPNDCTEEEYKDFYKSLYGF